MLAERCKSWTGYDVEAFNLATLHDTMAKFTTLTNQDFVVPFAEAMKRRFMAAASLSCSVRPVAGSAPSTVSS